MNDCFICGYEITGNNPAHSHFLKYHPNNLVHNNCELQWYEKKYKENLPPSCSYCLEISRSFSLFNAFRSIPKEIMKMVIPGACTAAFSAVACRSEALTAAVIGLASSVILNGGLSSAKIVEKILADNLAIQKIALCFGVGCGFKMAQPSVNWALKKLNRVSSWRSVATGMMSSVITSYFFNRSQVNRLFFTSN